jgi:uncharacterized protein (DUF486 family)
MEPSTSHPLPNDLGALVLIGAVLIALAVVLPIAHSGALAIAGLALVQVALAAWVIRTLERLDTVQQNRADQAAHALSDALAHGGQL